MWSPSQQASVKRKARISAENRAGRIQVQIRRVLVEFDRELSAEDIAYAAGCSINAARKHLQLMSKRGEAIERAHQWGTRPVTRWSAV